MQSLPNRLHWAQKRLPALLAAAAVLLGAAACGSSSAHAAPTLQVRDDLGRLVTLHHPAHRIVVLQPSGFEIVDALGLRKDIVGAATAIPTYTPAPWKAAADGLPSVGTSYPGISVERVVARRPDLVIATTGINGLNGLEALHIPVLILNPQSVAGVYHDIQLVGTLTGTVAKAHAVVQRLQSQMQALAAKAERRPTRPLVFYDLGGLYTAGPHTFVSSLIQMAGGVNLGARLSQAQYPQVTAEQVVAGDPAIILVDPDATSAAKEKQIPGFSTTEAGRTGRIEAIPNSAYVNEPSLGLVQGLTELIRLIHPHALS